MREQIKELCFFMICGQTLLHFQSGKKYEKICRMILELLVLAGVVGMILNFLQSLGIRKGDMPAAGGAVSNMQRSMEEALLKQLDPDGLDGELDYGISMEDMVEKYTLEEMRSKYNYFAGQYGFEIERVEQKEDKLWVFVKITNVLYIDIGTEEDGQTEGGTDEEGEAEEETREDIKEEIKGDTKEETEDTAGTENAAEKEEIRRVEIEEVDIDVEGTRERAAGQERQGEAGTKRDQDQLEEFHRQLALVLAMEEEKLEVVLID